MCLCVRAEKPALLMHARSAIGTGQEEVTNSPLKLDIVELKENAKK